MTIPVTLEADETKVVTQVVTPTVEGTHVVTVDSLEASFVVLPTPQIALQPGRNDIRWLGDTHDIVSLISPIVQYISPASPRVWLMKDGHWWCYYPGHLGESCFGYPAFTQLFNNDGISVDVIVTCMLPGHWEYTSL